MLCNVAFWIDVWNSCEAGFPNMNYTNGSTSKGTEQLQLLPAIIKYFCDLLF